MLFRHVRVSYKQELSMTCHIFPYKKANFKFLFLKIISKSPTLGSDGHSLINLYIP